jgi:hypothetical protein
MSDDSVRIKESLCLVGDATLATLELLESRGLLAPDSVVRDIALVLGKLIEVLMVWPGGYDEPEFAWVKAVIAKVEGHRISIAEAPFGVEESVRKCKEMDCDDDDDDDEDDEWEDEVKAPELTRSAWVKEVGSLIRKFISSLSMQIRADHYFYHSSMHSRIATVRSVAANTISARRPRGAKIS